MKKLQDTEYTGTLPATLQTVAGYLVGYKIWGNTGGVGAETENLAPFIDEWGDGYVNVRGLIAPATENMKERCSPHIAVEPGATYQLAYQTGSFPESSTSLPWTGVGWYNDDGFIERRAGYDRTTVTLVAPANAAYAILSFRSYGENHNVMFIKASTSPASYIPYGYKLPILSNETAIDIYIGDTALGKDEYVDSSVGRIYKRTVNLWNNEFTLGYHLDQSTGLPTEYTKDASRMATLSPIDVVNVDRVSFDFKNLSETSFSVMYSLLDEEETLLQRIVGRTAPLSFSVTNAAKLYIALYKSAQIISVSDVTDIMLVDGQSIPEQYIPYLTPTDPPAPLPQIPTAAGETTIDYGIAALPHAAGLDGIFEYGNIDGLTWKNSVSGENDITFDTVATDTGAEYILPAGASGQYTSKSGEYRTAFTWYCVAKCPTTCHSAGQYMISNLGNGIGVEISSGWTAYSSAGVNHLVRSINNNDFNSAEAVTSYALIVVSGDVNGVASVYVNGEKKTDSWNFNPVSSSGAATVFLGKRASSQLSGTDIDYKFLAFGTVKQTDAEIAANSQYLMTKYLGVGRPEKVELDVHGWTNTLYSIYHQGKWINSAEKKRVNGKWIPASS